MPDPLQALLGAGAVPATAFPPTSRYAAISVASFQPGDGSPPIPYLTRRLCPRLDRFSRLYEVTIAEGDRRDLLAARHAGDPELWWQLADANGVVDPRGLTERPGARIDVTLPADVQGRPMRDGVRLQLYTGPAVPIPAPRFVMDALQSVTVQSGAGAAASGFELTFEVSSRSPLHTMFLLGGGAAIPVMRVVIAVSVGGSTTVLIDGVMTHHEVRSAGPGTATLSIKGKDLSAVMDLFPLDGLPFPAMPPAVRVLTALAKYAALGIVPMVIPGIVEDIPIPIERIPRQQGTDLAYISALAEQAGYVFYMDPGPVPGVSKAYWGPELRLGVPQKSICAGLPEPQANAKDLQFRFDKEAKELPIVFIQEPNSKVPIPIPIPDVSPLTPPLGLVPPLPPRITPLKDTAKLSPLSAVMTGLAYAAKHGDSVFGSGTLDVARYGGVLRSRALVGVRGAGDAFDGLHYVTSVTSTMRSGEFSQSFQLARNALLSTLPKLPS